MKRIERSALVSYSAEQMFILVNNVEDYPKFMNGCRKALILERGEDWMRAELQLGKLGISQSFITRNEFCVPETIKLSLDNGPFKHFSGEWQFKALSNEACKVSFWLEFEFANPVLGLAAGRLFEQVASEQVDAVCDRARHVYAND